MHQSQNHLFLVCHPQGWLVESPVRSCTGCHALHIWQRCLCIPVTVAKMGQHGPTFTRKTGSIFQVDGLVAINFIFPLILGISSSQLTNSYFSEGWPWPTHQLMIKSEVFPQWFGCQVAITNCGTSLIAGCVTFPVLGRQWLWPWPYQS